MQDASVTRDEEFANNVNGLLQDPEYNPVWSASASTSQPRASTSQAQSLPFVLLSFKLRCRLNHRTAHLRYQVSN
jgi:hypothetical protein